MSKPSHLLSETGLERQTAPIVDPSAQAILTKEKRLENIQRFTTGMVRQLREGDIVRVRSFNNVCGTVMAFTQANTFPSELTDSLYNFYPEVVNGLDDDEDIPMTFDFAATEPLYDSARMALYAMYPFIKKMYFTFAGLDLEDDADEEVPIWISVLFVGMSVMPNLFLGLPTRQYLYQKTTKEVAAIIAEYMQSAGVTEEMAEDARVIVQMSCPYDPSKIAECNATTGASYYFRSDDLELVDRPNHTGHVLDEVGREGLVIDRDTKMITIPHAHTMANATKASMRMGRDYAPYGRGSLISPTHASIALGPRWKDIYLQEQAVDATKGCFTYNPSLCNVDNDPTVLPMSFIDVQVCQRACDMDKLPGPFGAQRKDPEGQQVKSKTAEEQQDDNDFDNTNLNPDAGSELEGKTFSVVAPSSKKQGKKKASAKAKSSKKDQAEKEEVDNTAFYTHLNNTMKRQLPNHNVFVASLFPPEQGYSCSVDASDGAPHNRGVMWSLVSSIIGGHSDLRWDLVFDDNARVKYLQSVACPAFSLEDPSTIDAIRNVLRTMGTRRGHMCSDYQHLQATRAAHAKITNTSNTPLVNRYYVSQGDISAPLMSQKRGTPPPITTHAPLEMTGDSRQPICWTAQSTGSKEFCSLHAHGGKHAHGGNLDNDAGIEHMVPMNLSTENLNAITPNISTLLSNNEAAYEFLSTRDVPEPRPPQATPTPSTNTTTNCERLNVMLFLLTAMSSGNTSTWSRVWMHETNVAMNLLTAAANDERIDSLFEKTKSKRLKGDPPRKRLLPAYVLGTIEKALDAAHVTCGAKLKAMPCPTPVLSPIVQDCIPSPPVNEFEWQHYLRHAWMADPTVPQGFTPKDLSSIDELLIQDDDNSTSSSPDADPITFVERVVSNAIPRKVLHNNRHLWATDVNNVNNETIVTPLQAGAIMEGFTRKAADMLKDEYSHYHSDDLGGIDLEDPASIGIMEAVIDNDLLHPSKVQEDLMARLPAFGSTVSVSPVGVEAAGGILSMSLPQMFLENTAIKMLKDTKPDVYSTVVGMINKLFHSLFVGHEGGISSVLKETIAEAVGDNASLSPKLKHQVSVIETMSNVFAASHFWRVALDAAVDVALVYIDADGMNSLAQKFTVLTTSNAFSSSSRGLLMSSLSFKIVSDKLDALPSKPTADCPIDRRPLYFPQFDFLTGTEDEYRSMLDVYGLGVGHSSSTPGDHEAPWAPLFLATRSSYSPPVAAIDTWESVATDWKLNVAGGFRSDVALAALKRSFQARSYPELDEMMPRIIPMGDILGVLPSKYSGRPQCDPYEFSDEPISLSTRDILTVSDIPFGATVGTTVIAGEDFAKARGFPLHESRMDAFRTNIYPVSIEEHSRHFTADNNAGLHKWYLAWRQAQPHLYKVLKSTTVNTVAFEDGQTAFGVPSVQLIDMHDVLQIEGPTLDELANPTKRGDLQRKKQVTEVGAAEGDDEDFTDEDTDDSPYSTCSSEEGSDMDDIDWSEADSARDFMRDFEDMILPTSIVQPSVDYARAGVAAVVKSTLGPMLPPNAEGVEYRKGVRALMGSTTATISERSIPVWTQCLTTNQVPTAIQQPGLSSLEALATAHPARCNMPDVTRKAEHVPTGTTTAIVNDWTCPVYAIRLLGGVTLELEVGSAVRIAREGPRELSDLVLQDRASHRGENGAGGAGGGSKVTEFFTPWWGDNLDTVPCYLGVVRNIDHDNMIASVTWFEQFSDREGIIARRKQALLTSPLYSQFSGIPEDQQEGWAAGMAACIMGTVVGLLANTMVRVRWADGTIEDVSRMDVFPLNEAGEQNDEEEDEEADEEEDYTDEDEEYDEDWGNQEVVHEDEIEEGANIAEVEDLEVPVDRDIEIHADPNAPLDLQFTNPNISSFIACSVLGSNILEKLSNYTATPTRGVMRRLKREWESLRDYCNTLNASDVLSSGAGTASAAIHVRVCPDAPNVIKVAMMGPVHTPYYQSLLCFDIAMTDMYPIQPPLCRFYSYGMRINPNLYDTGHVCLSLLGTWDGEAACEKWSPVNSVIAHIIQSMQALVLTKEPYYNEAGYDHFMGDPKAVKFSKQYNEDTALVRIRHMMAMADNPPVDWRREVQQHYTSIVPGIMRRLQAVVDGGQTPPDAAASSSSASGGSITADGIVLPATPGFIAALRYHLTLLRQQYVRITTQWKAKDAELKQMRKK